MKLYLVFMMRYKYINYNLYALTNVSSSSRVTKFKDILTWNMSQMITKAAPISTRIIIKYAMKRGIPFWVWQKIDGNRGNNLIRTFQWRQTHCRTNISFRRKKLIQKNRTVWVTVRNPTRKVNHLSIWDKTILTKFTRSFSSTRIGKPVSIMDVEVSKDKHITNWVDWENLIYIRWNSTKNRLYRQRRWMIGEIEVKCWMLMEKPLGSRY